jgi:hypothetical protein
MGVPDTALYNSIQFYTILYSAIQLGPFGNCLVPLKPNVFFTAKTASHASRLTAGFPRGIPYTVLYKSTQMDTTLYSSEGDTLYNAIQLYTIPYTCIQLYTAPKVIPYAALYNSIQLDRTVYSLKGIP